MVTEEEFRRRAHELAAERLKGLRAGEIPSYKIRVRIFKPKQPEKVKITVVNTPLSDPGEPEKDIKYTHEELSEYRKNIKDRCFICGYSYKNDFQQYLVRGNCCSPCSVRIADYLKRKITRKECDLMLSKRVLSLKNNQ